MFRTGKSTLCDWYVTQKQRCTPTELESRKVARSRPGWVDKGKGKEKEVEGMGWKGRSEMTEVLERLDRMAREMVKMKEEMGQMKEVLKDGLKRNREIHLAQEVLDTDC